MFLTQKMQKNITTPQEKKFIILIRHTIIVTIILRTYDRQDKTLPHLANAFSVKFFNLGGKTMYFVITFNFKRGIKSDTEIIKSQIKPKYRLKQ